MVSIKSGSPICSVRHRVLRQSFANIKQTSPSESELDPERLKPGEMQLYSYFSPSLPTGLYNIVTEQTISTSDGQSKTIKALDQSFLVDAPKYSIDPALIHSTFPHQGVPAQANILPHIVFNDPHLPWQIEIGPTSEEDPLRIPWLAVVVFERSELQLQPDDPLIPPNMLQGNTSLSQSDTMAVRLAVGLLAASGLQCALPVLSSDLQGDPMLLSKAIDVIFPKMDLFLALFSSNTSDAPQIDLDRFKYLAHARRVNTTHMSDSGILEEGRFSVVFSQRTGPPFEKGAPSPPKSCIAHLVSLDWIHRIPASALTSNKRTALISLFSWTYDCAPPGAVNFADVMKTVGENSALYRTPDEIRNEVKDDLPQAIHDRIKNRLDNGYTLTRYRVQTGQETVALMRGPLTPYADPEAQWTDVHSNTGQDLQIIDTQLGIIDISYSAAWQLGKSLAIADQAFCAALFRIRADVRKTSSKQAKAAILSQMFEPATSDRVIGALPSHFSDMKELSKRPFGQQRWNRPPLIQSRYGYLGKQKGSEIYSQNIDEGLRKQVEYLASATQTDWHYTEFNDPVSTDWDLVLNWILDKIYLEKIPPWYLIPDPSWLPAESIRFFHVDRKWLSALVDGALSVANHLDEMDRVRQCIKYQLMKYLDKEIHPELKHSPQVPVYGFYLRSVVVDAFPDLIVRAPWPPVDGDRKDPRAEILRQENVRKDIMFCLLDRTPSKDLQQLIISQPPHQQCFMFGQDSTFTTDSFDLALRKVYSVSTSKHMAELPKIPFSKGSDGRCDIFDWNTHRIMVDKFTGLIHSTLLEAHKQDPEVYDKDVNASLVGIQLNSPVYHLTFASGRHVEASTTDSATFDFPGHEAATATVLPPPVKNYAPPFKGVPRHRNVPHGQPRRSGMSPPPLAPPRADQPPKDGPKMKGPFFSTPELPSILSEIEYNDVEKCSSRFSPICFPIGSPSTATDDEPKYLTSLPKGSQVIVRLARNQTDTDSTDHIHIFEIRIPFGNAANSLFTKPLETGGARMLNTMRFVMDIGVYKNEVVIQLKPKAMLGLSPLSHNPDMSFMIKGANINPKAADSTISIVEVYKSKQGNTKVALNYIRHVQVKK